MVKFLMEKIDELLNKVPKSVKDKFLIKKRERAIEIVKEKITQANKSTSDYDDIEMEGFIGDEEKNLNYDQLKTMLIAVLAVEGLSNLI
jgi:hypothetical protein